MNHLFQIWAALIRFINRAPRRRHPRIVIPFVRGMLAPETKALGEQLRAEFVDVTGDTTSYHSLMSRLWSEGEQFVIVEQDVVPTVEMLHEMWTCPEEWCHGYWVDPADDTHMPHSQWLGCARFSASLLQRAPDMMKRVGRHFNQQDIDLWYQLKSIRDDRGPHIHHPPVTHMHIAMEQRRAAAGLPASNSDWVEANSRRLRGA